jgi:hypothetical protein
MARSGSISLPIRTRSALAAGTALLSLTFAACAPAPPLSDVEQKVFAHSCVFSSCHAANGSPAGGLSLAGSTFEKLVNVKSTLVPQKQRVVPFDPDQSFLYEKISQDKPSAGMRMPPGQPLAEDEIAMIRAWIVAGAENK